MAPKRYEMTDAEWERIKDMIHHRHRRFGD